MSTLSKLATPLAAVAILSMLAMPASAGGFNHHSGRDVAAAGVIGLIGGAMLGAALAAPQQSEPQPGYYAPPPVYYNPPPPPPVYYRPAPVVVYRPAPPVVYAEPESSEHTAWCAGRYRSYNAYDNTWIDNYGRLRPCQSPYGG